MLHGKGSIESGVSPRAATPFWPNCIGHGIDVKPCSWLLMIPMNDDHFRCQARSKVLSRFTIYVPGSNIKGAPVLCMVHKLYQLPVLWEVNLTQYATGISHALCSFHCLRFLS